MSKRQEEIKRALQKINEAIEILDETPRYSRTCYAYILLSMAYNMVSVQWGEEVERQKI